MELWDLSKTSELISLGRVNANFVLDAVAQRSAKS